MIESLNVDEENLEWKPQFKMSVYEISLNPPHNTKLSTQMPDSRCSHGCEIIDNQVVVAGGQTSRYAKDAKNTVYAYNLDNSELKTLSPLPFPVTEMATVSY